MSNSTNPADPYVRDPRGQFAKKPETSAGISLAPEIPDGLEIDFYGRPRVSNTATADQLADFATHEDRNVRRSVALARDTPHHTLRLLAHDPDQGVRKSLTLRHTLPADVMMTLAKDPYGIVRVGVVSRPDAPEQALDILSNDPYTRVRYLVALHPHVSDETRARLVDDPDHRVANAARNPHRTIAHEERMARKAIGDHLTGDARAEALDRAVEGEGPGIGRRTLRPSIRQIMEELAREKDRANTKAEDAA